MRLLFVVHQSLPRWMGGTELYTQQLAEALVRRGHVLRVFAREFGARGLERDELHGVVIDRVHTPTRSDAALFRATFGAAEIERAFGRVLAEFQPDAVHFHHLLGLPAALFWRAVQAGLPTVITLHDYWFVCSNTKLLTNDDDQLCAGPRAWINCARCGLARLDMRAAFPAAPLIAPLFAARDWVVRRVLQRADRLIAPSRFLRDVHLRFGVKPERVRVVPTGIQPPPFPPSPRDASRNELRVLYVGALLPLKGVHVLVEAFNGLPPEAQLRIVGDPERDAAYARRLRAQAHHPGIRFLGALERDRVWARLAEADVVAVPSLWYENSPLVVQEAFAVRRPVLASRLGALAELVRDGVDGWLIPAGDVEAWRKALVRLAQRPAKIEQLQSGISPVRTVDHLARDMEAVYAGLLGV